METPFPEASILVVDDEPANVRLLTHLLQQWGYTNVVTATEAARVVPICRAHTPDLVLLDLHMPLLDGFQLLAQLRPWIDANPALPVLVVTGDMTSEACERALAAGACDFITKPYSQGEVRLRVGNQLKMRKAQIELKAHTEALEVTTHVARAIGGKTDIDVILDLVATRGRALVSARALVVELKQRDQLVVAASAGDLPAGLAGVHMPAQGTVAAHALRTKRTQRLEEEVNHSRFDERGLGRLGVEANGGLVVPLVFHGTAYGALVALDRLHGGPAFTSQDERLLEALAASAATAVATAHSAASERHRQRIAAAEAERQRWARELHDDTLQSLAALRLGLAAAIRPGSTRPAGQAVEQAVQQLEESIANLRALITDLRPAALDELGVQAAVEALADRTRRRGMEVVLRCQLVGDHGPQSVRLAAELEIALYRIAQEALTNATKHGHAGRALVEIREGLETVELSVSDDGCGFDPDAHSDGFGLLGIRERVELLGGELSVDSAPSRGTIVRASFPLRRRTDLPLTGERAATTAVRQAGGRERRTSFGGRARQLVRPGRSS